MYFRPLDNGTSAEAADTATRLTATAEQRVRPTASSFLAASKGLHHQPVGNATEKPGRGASWPRRSTTIQSHASPHASGGSRHVHDQAGTRGGVARRGGVLRPRAGARFHEEDVHLRGGGQGG